MNKLVRIAVGATGTVLMLIGIAAWIDPTAMGAKLGIGAIAVLGHATLRADLGAFFLTAGSLAIAAAIQRRAALLTAPLAMMALALMGRGLSLIALPFDVSLVPPMVAEALMVAILASGRYSLGRA